MRKFLLAILVVILLIVTGLVIYQGISIGNFEIWGIKQIAEENETIERANEKLKTLVDNEFPNAVSKLNNSGEVMQEAKKEYEEQAVIVSNSKYYMQTEKYKLEFLWTRIGNYAKDHKVTPKMEVASGSTNGVYNLIITAVGKYSDVASFIYAIENDSRLGFKIEDFSMTQYTSDGANLVQGKFTCKEIRIDIKSIDSDGNSTSNANNEGEENQRSNTSNNNTSNTNTTNAGNTTKSTNKTNTTNSTNTTSSQSVENATSVETTASTTGT